LSLLPLTIRRSGDKAVVHRKQLSRKSPGEKSPAFNERTERILELFTGSKSRAACISAFIHRASRLTGISEPVIVTTAYIESGFDMNSKPCVGVMQIWLPSWRSDGDTRLNPWDLKDNILLGAQELARKKPASNTEESLRVMWGRYNGSGPDGAYAGRALRVYEILVNDSLQEIKRRLRRGDLWKSRKG